MIFIQYLWYFLRKSSYDHETFRMNDSQLTNAFSNGKDSPKYFQSRAKKDDFLLRNQSKLTKMVIEIQQPLSPKLAQIYAQMAELHEKSDFTAMTQEMTKLFSYALDNFVDYDKNFEDFGMYTIIFDCLTKKMPISLRKATIAFLSNVFQNPNTIILSNMFNNGIIQILSSILYENIESLQYPVLQCVINISADSQIYRDEVLKLFKLDALRFLMCNSNKKIAKSAARLVAAFCQFPLDTKSLESILNFFIDVFLEVSRELLPTLVNVMISFVNSNEACQLFVSKSEESSNTILKVFESLLSEPNPQTVINTLIFVDKLAEGYKNIVDFDYLKILMLIQTDNDKISYYAIRVISNAIVLNPQISQLVIDNNFMPQILEVYSNGSGNSRIETVFLMTNLVRQSNQQIFDLLCKNYQLVTIFVDALNVEEQELVDSIICALTKMMQSEISNPTQKKIRDQFYGASGNEVIEMLINSENNAISQQAYAFHSLVLEERKPFEFVLS
ncbi:hypothetical protein TRFO_22680 [Tritrichomonas foetus]|uniref:Armadillo repeat-containing domain-containing protein n=1 Tax=Tritrichomonas foetus TaxID=1144522 RepID=A0A1J4KBG9_9EUKA|nr:hypothetical protein TRFO_22680 [Tritrichomonas foetus]|eukprot:OHT08761.1 hypothetical protein TRFO_22680 [Tritrichomonas foetus]